MEKNTLKLADNQAHDRVCHCSKIKSKVMFVEEDISC